MRSLALGLIALMAAMSCAHAADRMALAGTEISGLGSYTYAGIVMPLARSSPERGPAVRHWLERLTYEYDNAGIEHDAERYGYAPAIGWQQPLRGGYVSGYAGARLAHTDLSPADPGNDDDGTTVRGFLQGDAMLPLGERIENEIVAGFELGYGDYYVRDRLMVRSGNLRLGPEVVFKGGDDYDGWQAGIALGGLHVSERLQLLVRGGISGQRDESNSAYGSIELLMFMPGGAR